MDARFYDEPGTFAEEEIISSSASAEENSLYSLVDNAQVCPAHERAYYCGDCPICQLESARVYFRNLARQGGLVNTEILTLRNNDRIPVYEVLP